ncbi:MAG: gliding motility-associated C-terminal domain-containing protein [Bacteroidetes bacterium]|nr:gliding motility-associated C-terminal domain-containing protein [Bacteroidota bacterium]
MHSYLLRFSLVFLILSGFSGYLPAQAVLGPPPANDDAANAADFGALPAPLPCPVGGDGTMVSVNGTTAFATYNSNYYASFGCYSGGSPDVWYKFNAVSNYTHLSFQSLTSPGFDSCYIRVWKTNGLNHSPYQLIPLNCIRIDNGQHAENLLTTSGDEYYIEIGGQQWDDTGSFVLQLEAERECEDCVRRANVNLFPAPVYGIYGLSQKVKMCATLTEWDYSATNYPHYIGPAQLGGDWDAGSLQPMQSPGAGWSWFTAPAVTLPGYYFDPDGNNDPTDNAGDNSISPFVDLRACWQVQVNSNCNQNDLSATIKIYSDEVFGTGNQTNECDDGLQHVIDLHNQCCKAPEAFFTQVNCATPNSGQITLNNALDLGKDSVAFMLFDNLLTTAYDSAFSVAGQHIFTNLSNGHYIIRTIQYQAGNPTCTSFVSIFLPSTLQMSLSQTSAGCTSGAGVAHVQVTGNATFTYSWTIGSTIVSQVDSAVNLPNGWITCTVTDITNLCTITDSIFITSLSPPAIVLSYSNSDICSSTTTLAPDTTTTSGGVFSLVNTVAGVSINSSTGVLSLNGTAFPYSVPVLYTYTDASTGCSTSKSDTVVVVQQPGIPPLQFTSPQNLCLGDPAPQLSVQPAGNLQVGWANSTFTNVTYAPSFIPPVNTSGSTTYGVAYVTQGGCIGLAAFFNVNVYEAPTLQVNADVEVCPGDTINAVVTATPSAGSVLWSPVPAIGAASDASVFYIAPQFPGNTAVSVTVTDASGTCSTSEGFLITADTAGCSSGNGGGVNQNEVETYSGITPNGDGKNDTWVIDGITGIQGVEVEIYNRWGMLIWQNSQYDNTTNVWKGTDSSGQLLPEGTYFYIIRKSTIIKKGWIELNR